MSNKRIPKLTLDNNFYAGQILTAADVNKIVQVLRAGINYNKYSIDTLLAGNSNVYVVDAEALLTGIEDAVENDVAFVFEKIEE